MAQPSPTLASNPEMRTIELSQLLERLQKTILHPDAERERRLRTSEYERARTSSNLAFARDLLTRVEQDAFAIKAPGRRQEVQVDLSRRRELLEQSYDRMKDLEEMAEDEDDESDEGEDILAGFVGGSVDVEPQGQASDDGGGTHHSRDADSKIPESISTSSAAQSKTPTPSPAISTPPPPQQQPQQLQQQPPTQTTSELGSRKQAPEPQSQTTARAALFSRRRPAPTTAVQSITAEAILDRQREEQEELSKHILTNASRLKESSQMFSRMLAEDREAVDRASESMDTTGRRMDAAGSRMGLLTRMTEGEGWLGRMKLYAMVYALLVACFIVVFVSPKIRF